GFHIFFSQKSVGTRIDVKFKKTLPGGIQFDEHEPRPGLIGLGQVGGFHSVAPQGFDEKVPQDVPTDFSDKGCGRPEPRDSHRHVRRSTPGTFLISLLVLIQRNHVHEGFSQGEDSLAHGRPYLLSRSSWGGTKADPVLPSVTQDRVRLHPILNDLSPPFEGRSDRSSRRFFSGRRGGPCARNRPVVVPYAHSFRESAP